MPLLYSTISAIAEKTAISHGLDPLLFVPAVGHNWNYPDLIVPEISITFAGSRTVATQDTDPVGRLQAKGYMCFESKRGMHRARPVTNPLTGGRLSDFPFLNARGVAVFRQALYEVYRQIQAIENPSLTPMTQKEYFDALDEELKEITPIAYIGDTITHAGVTGTLVKELSTLLHILTPTGLVKVKR